MGQESNINIDRLAGAEAISAKAKAIGMENGVVIHQADWDIGKDVTHQYAHRLDLFSATNSVRLYFPDLELTTSGNEAREKRTRDRLQSAIARLLPRQPSPTYGTSAAIDPLTDVRDLFKKTVA
jgi:hypothetical protein